MSGAIPFHKHSVGRTFLIAITVLGIGALTQFGALCWLFFSRFHALPAGEVAGAPLNAPPVNPKDFTDPFGDPPAAANLPTAVPTKPQPVPTTVAPAADSGPADRLSELLEQGKMLRERGDTYASVTKLREAEAMAENNPLPTAELAMTYEKMGFAEKATECWKRIFEMGEAAGVYFAAADGRLKAAQLAESTGGTPQPTNADGTPATAASTAIRGETVGLNANCKLGLLEITRQDLTDPGAKRKFVLHVPVKAKSRARIDVHDVIVTVQFYDIINGKSLDRTNATVNYRWSNPPADWADDDVESLEVSYTLPDLRVTDEDRKYYGYMVSLYYKNALQDYRSDPPAIATKATPAAALAQDPP